MNDEIVFDTNIIAYVFDKDETLRREASGDLFRKVLAGRIKGVVSNQILAELYNFLTVKMRQPLAQNISLSLIDGIIASDHWVKVDYDTSTVKGALDIVEKFKCSIWDAIIVATMKENGLKKIYTEDKFFKKVPGLKAINPFRK